MFLLIVCDMFSSIALLECPISAAASSQHIHPLFPSFFALRFSPPSVRRGVLYQWSRCRGGTLVHVRAASNQAKPRAPPLTRRNHHPSEGKAAWAKRSELPSLQEANPRKGLRSATDQQPHIFIIKCKWGGKTQPCRCSWVNECKVALKLPADLADNVLKTYFSSQYSTITTQAGGRDRRTHIHTTKADLSPVEMTSALCDKLHTNI